MLGHRLGSLRRSGRWGIEDQPPCEAFPAFKGASPYQRGKSGALKINRVARLSRSSREPRPTKEGSLWSTTEGTEP